MYFCYLVSIGYTYYSYTIKRGSEKSRAICIVVGEGGRGSKDVQTVGWNHLSLLGVVNCQGIIVLSWSVSRPHSEVSITNSSTCSISITRPLPSILASTGARIACIYWFQMTFRSHQSTHSRAQISESWRSWRLRSGHFGTNNFGPFYMFNLIDSSVSTIQIVRQI